MTQDVLADSGPTRRAYPLGLPSLVGGLPIFALVVWLAACDGGPLSGSLPAVEAEKRATVGFETAVVQLVTPRQTHRLRVQIASNAAQRSQGLMDRTQLGQDEGMLFIYESEQPAEAGFWMHRTLIPLDIAYLDATGRIAAIRAMEPCPVGRDCPTYAPGVRYRAALEVNRGYFAKNGVAVGDRLIPPPPAIEAQRD